MAPVTPVAHVTPCGMAPVTPVAQFQGLRKGFLIGDEPAQRPMDVSASVPTSAVSFDEEAL